MDHMELLDEDMRFDSPWDVIMGIYEPYVPKLTEFPELDVMMSAEEETSDIGHIYRITNVIDGKVYIGQTEQDPDQRKQGHKTCCNHYRDHPEQYNVNGGKRSACYKLYNAMIKYGSENFTFEVLCSVPVCCLDDEETKQIRIHDSINNGYNILEGGSGSGKFTPEIRAKMAEKIRAAMPAAVDKIRRCEQSKTLPVFISWDTELQGYRIRHPTLCNNKNFSVFEFGSQETAKDAAVKFLKDLIESGVPYISDKVKNKLRSEQGDPLPKGIRKALNGYVACRQYKGIRYYHRFSDKSKSDTEKLELAKLFIKAADDAFVRLHGAPRK